MAEVCEEQVEFTQSLVMSEPVARLSQAVADPDAVSAAPDAPYPVDVTPARFVPEMVGSVVAQVQALIADQGIS